MLFDSSTLAALRFFEAAARLLSFKQAALELHVTQGAVSQQIKHLEGALGYKLFSRLPRQIVLTPEGQRLATVVARSFEDIRREARSIASMRPQSDVRVRVGPSFALRWLVPRLADFYARHPNVKLSVTAAHGRLDSAVREFDLGIELVCEVPAAMRSEVLMDEYLVPVCSPAYLAAHSFLQQPVDLAGCTLLHDDHAWPGASRNAEWAHWLHEVGESRVDSDRGQFFSLATLAIEAALTHQGVAMGRVSLIAELLETRQLVAPLASRARSPTRYHLIYPEDLAESPPLKSVIRWLHEQADLSRRP